MSKHTPGPWRAGRPDMATIVEGFESKYIYSEKRKYVAIATGEDIKNWDEVMANARLIAAAPEMLDAIRAHCEECAYFKATDAAKCRECKFKEILRTYEKL